MLYASPEAQEDLRLPDHPSTAARTGYYVAKRLLDVVSAAVLIAAIAPVLLLIALCIRLDSPGPAIYSQQRLRGRRVKVDGRWTWRIEPFTMHKFRTMTSSAAPTVHQDFMRAYIAGDDEEMRGIDGASSDSHKLTHDPRITRLGALLRRTSIDELPQLWDVVTGRMSLVGPRPPLPYEVEMYDERHLARLASPAGMTGWWQVRGRCETPFEEMVRLDLEYIRRCSIWLDLKILTLTVPAVLSGRGAG